MVLMKSMLGAIANATSLGSQKMPYPVRITVLSSTRYAMPRRGAKEFRSSKLVRDDLKSEFTSANCPRRSRPVSEDRGLTESSESEVMRSKRSEKFPERSQRNPMFTVSLSLTCHWSLM